MAKTKQQAKQEQRLQKNIRQAKRNRADIGATPKGTKPPTRRGGVRPQSKKAGGGVSSTLSAKFFGRADAPQTVQQSIPYREMYRDGICRVTDKLYTKTIQFSDINYQLGATRSHTNTIPQGIKLCGRLDHVVLKMGGFRQSAEAITYTLMSGMMG